MLREGELPVLTLGDSALRHNIELMSSFAERNALELYPHTKTALSPQITRMQLDAGASGVSVTSVAHAQRLQPHLSEPPSMYLIANQVVDQRSLSELATLLKKPGETVGCFVDSMEAIELIEAVTSPSTGTVGKPRIFVELGALEGRSGVRSFKDAMRLGERVAKSPYLELLGVAGYEGAIARAPRSTRLSDSTVQDAIRRVDVFIESLKELAVRYAARSLVSGVPNTVITVGGSLFLDRIVHAFRSDGNTSPFDVMIRPGSYVTHDSGRWNQLSSMGVRSTGRFQLQPALELWAVVLSRPEPQLAILGFGRRDVPFDAGLPIAWRVGSLNGKIQDAVGVEVVGLDDHHAYAQVPRGALEVGSLVSCGISHPCGAFERWRTVPIVNDRYEVVDVVDVLL